MPLRPLLGRPGSGEKRRNSVNFAPSQKTSETSIKSGHKRENSFKRLSLGILDPSHENYTSFFTQEPDEIETRRNSAQAAASPASDKQTLPFPPVPEQSEPHETPSEVGSPAPADEDVVVRPQRFSLLRFRNASDPQLSTRFKKSTATPPKAADPPTMIVTSPTSHEMEAPVKKRAKTKTLGRPSSPLRQSRMFRPTSSRLAVHDKDLNPVISAPDLGLAKPSSEHNRAHSNSTPAAPPAYGDETSSSLAIPVSRLSESSRSDGSSGEHRVYAQTTTTHTILTTTTFFKLKKKKKDKGPLFPLPERFTAPASGRTSMSAVAGVREEDPPGGSISLERRSTTVRFDTASERHSGVPSPTHSTVALTNAPSGHPGPNIVRKHSTVSTHSGNSIPPTLMPPRSSIRGRASTLGSFGKSVEKLVDNVPNITGSSRNSTSTTGRRSFGDLLAIPHRKRQNSAPASRYGGASNSPSIPGSKSNSLQIAREQEAEINFPARDDSDTPATYIEKLEAAVPRSAMATVLCKTADDFSKTCLRKYMRGFAYFGDSIDIAMRKMLMEVELPKETQQIDRLLQGFADRYNECNPGIFVSPDEANFISFSILLLHSDTHNKNNKRKMQKEDYVKNTQQGPYQVSGDILECFYDNVCYTPFIHFDDDVAIHSHRMSVPRPKKSLIRTKSSENLRGPIDPYVLILDNKMADLRPPLKEVLDTEDTYSCLGTATSMDVDVIHNAFSNHAVLQIISARSRPDAFMTQATITNPSEAQAGLVSIKVAKVGLIWRKDSKKKKAKSPWKEWGAILTDSKLYFFKDVNWVKRLIAQYDGHTKLTGKLGSLVFKPPLTAFEPDAFISMDDTVALMDSNYKKHKNAFTFVKHGGFEEVFLANTEAEMNDWIHKLNYAATFRTAGIRLRGLLGTNYEGKRIFRTDSEVAANTDSPVDIPSRSSIPSKDRIDPQVVWEIMFYRRQLINEKISDFDEKIAAAQKELDHLLRNARHLLILLPVQAKSREALVFAAARMSAKLKWTRTELWRTKAHRDVLVKDLEQENVEAFPATTARNSLVNTPQKITPLRTHPSISRMSTEPAQLTASPISISSPSLRSPPQPAIDVILSPDVDEKSAAASRTTTMDRNSFFSNSPLSDETGRPDSVHNLHALVHQASTLSSHRSRSDHEAFNAPLDPEDQVLRDAGLLGVEGFSPKDKRPDTSESERDKLNTVSSAPEPLQSRVGSVKRSLQRSLRDTSREPNKIHRHKKGRESGSSLPFAPEETPKASGVDTEELKRGTGSFILHGKKASVVTMSPEWQAMSSEDRLKLRKSIPSSSRMAPYPTESADEATSLSSRRTSFLDNVSTMDTPSRQQSVVTATDNEAESAQAN